MATNIEQPVGKTLPRLNAREEFTGLFLPSDGHDDASVRVVAEIIALGLERNAWELDNLGYTVLAPHQVGAGDLADRLREKLLDFAEGDLGFRPDLENGDQIKAEVTAIGRGHFMPAVMFKDALFEHALMTRSVLALMTYLLGENCILSSNSAMLKVRAPEQLELHTDMVGQPAPFPPYAQVANATWALTDYSPDNGAIKFVPGSHKLARHPSVGEALDDSTAITITAPAGSVIIWNGNTWHGAAPRTNPGGRLSLIFLFCRWYLMPQMMHRQWISQEALARNEDRFTVLMGKRSPYSGLDSDGQPVDFTLGQPITGALTELLLKERQQRDDQEGYIFAVTRMDGMPGHRRTMARQFARAVIRANLEPRKVTPHVMRHTAITQLVKAGIDLPTIQRISGHKTLAMVMRYVHLSGEHIDTAMAAIDTAFPDVNTPELHTPQIIQMSGAA